MKQRLAAAFGNNTNPKAIEDPKADPKNDADNVSLYSSQIRTKLGEKDKKEKVAEGPKADENGMIMYNPMAEEKKKKKKEKKTPDKIDEANEAAE